MRIDEIISGYRQQDTGCALAERGNARRKGKSGRHTSALIFDTVDLHRQTPDSDHIPEWLTAYIRLMPDEMAIEKINRSFATDDSKVELLINKIILFSL